MLIYGSIWSRISQTFETGWDLLPATTLDFVWSFFLSLETRIHFYAHNFLFKHLSCFLLHNLKHWTYSLSYVQFQSFVVRIENIAAYRQLFYCTFYSNTYRENIQISIRKQNLQFTPVKYPINTWTNFQNYLSTWDGDIHLHFK